MNELEQLYLTIKATKRIGVKPDKKLLRFVAVLERINQWERKRKLAETKLKKYKRIAQRYRKSQGA